MLLDELITNAFKTAFAAAGGSSDEEFERRYEQIREVLDQRLEGPVSAAIHDLCIVSMATWQAQEVVMASADDNLVAQAARHAQTMNARRTRLIREIDRLLGESHISITSKTYG